jgi:hypothetical protein
LGQSLSSLPPEDRARLYRQFAAEAIRRSEQSARQELRAGHLSMAAGWHALALELEDSLGRINESFVHPALATGHLRPAG